MQIWQLTPTTEQFGSPYISTKADAAYYVELFGERCYQGASIESHWQPTMVYNFIKVDIGRLAFGSQEFWMCTEQAKEVLEPLLSKSVEFLPLIHRDKTNQKISTFKQLFFNKTYKPLLDLVHTKPHYLMHILDIRTLDVIDAEHSEFEFNEEKQEIFLTESLAFHPKKIEHTHIFKIIQHGRGLAMRTFVSDEFRRIIQKNKLTGLVFSAAEGDEGNLVWRDDVREVEHL